MSIYSKVIILIGLGVLMAGLQFGVNRFIDERKSRHLQCVYELDRMSESLLNAIIEEKSFIKSHQESAADKTVEFVKRAGEYMASLRADSLVKTDKLTVLENLLTEYREAFGRLTQTTKEMDSVELDLGRSIMGFNEKSRQMVRKIGEYIGTAMSNVEEVDEHVRSLSDMARDITVLLNQISLLLKHDLFGQNDQERYLAESKKTLAELMRQKRNVDAGSAFIKDPQYIDFIKLAVEIIDSLPSRLDGIHHIWKEKTALEVHLDSIRGRIVEAKGAILESAHSNMDDFVTRIHYLNFLSFLLTLLALCLGGVLILRSITRPISLVTAAAREISNGDLRHASERLAVFSTDGASPEARESEKDEIRQLAHAFVRMTESLRSLIGQVRRSGIQVVSSATEISATAHQLEATAAQQIASITEVSATTREISSESEELVKTMSDVAVVASETASVAEDGQRGLQGMEATMRRLMETTASIASKLGAISGKTENIGTIVSTISKVAEQTNLLSLNAAIEAEKAGQYGLGFAVVAREIRRLADQTAVATLNIVQMVKGMQSAVSAGVMEVDKFVKQVHNGVEDIEKIGGQMGGIIDRVRAFVPHFEAVNQAVRVQSAGAEGIYGAMSQLSEGAQQARQVVSELNRATGQLTGAVHELRTEVSNFKVSS
jgi:methyl-accepting chemotaxis protein WspA